MAPPLEASEGASALIWDSGFHNYKRIYFYCFKPPVCGALLPRPWETETRKERKERRFLQAPAS